MRAGTAAAEALMSFLRWFDMTDVPVILAP
jgi:hypothetical protein